jgi:hypothetical protein
MSEEEVTKPSPPPQPTTKAIPAADPVLIAIATLTTEVRGARVDISLVSNDLSIVKDRVTVLETERSKLSGGVRQLSNADMSKDALISELSKKIDDVATETNAQTLVLHAISDNAAKFVASPRVKIAGGILFGLLAKWLADRYGIHLPQ